VRTLPKTILAVSLILFLCVPPALAKQVFGKIISVADGDTITVLVDRTQMKVRLAEIDAPEKRQPFGTRAKQAMSELVFGKTVGVVTVDRDRYGRTVGLGICGKWEYKREDGAAWLRLGVSKVCEKPDAVWA
jgi:endonuclease YncB( thermonuclease family)